MKSHLSFTFWSFLLLVETVSSSDIPFDFLCFSGKGPFNIKGFDGDKLLYATLHYGSKFCLYIVYTVSDLPVHSLILNSQRS